MALLVVLGLSGSTALAAPDGTAQQAGSAVKVPARAMDAVAAMQPSWNLGNTLDAIPDETSWGNPKATRELFRTIRAEGFRSVRIPVTWSAHQSATAPYTVDDAYMSRVKQVVDWALAEDLYVVLNIHHDSWQWISKMLHRPRQGARPLQPAVDPDRRRDSGTSRAPCSSRASTSRVRRTPRTLRRPSSSTS